MKGNQKSNKRKNPKDEYKDCYFCNLLQVNLLKDKAQHHLILL